MSTNQRQMRLGLFVQTVGHHVAGWRHPDAETGSQNFDLIRRIVQTAEAAKFDMAFFADGLTTTRDTHPSMVVRFEPLTVLSALAMVTSRIGLAATVSTTYSEPFHVARSFASLDHLSQGRAGWNVVTTSYARSSANFSRGNHPEHSERYAIAAEFVQVVKGLWDSWDEDAFPMDKSTGIYFDPDKQHELNHQGRYFNVKGPLNVERSPQGHAVIIQAGSSEPGQDLAAETADVVFTAQQTLEEAKAFYDSLKGRLPRFGRDASQLHVMPGVFPVIGRTEAEAKGKYKQLQDWVDSSNAFSLLSDRLGFDVSGFPLDGPLPELPESDQIKSRARLLTDLARRENLTLRELYHLVAGARGHRIVWGTADQVADALQEWFEGGGADGFNIMPPYFPGGLDEFVQQVVPILQARGLFRTEYEGTTLRDHLGLARPAAPRRG